MPFPAMHASLPMNGVNTFFLSTASEVNLINAGEYVCHGDEPPSRLAYLTSPSRKKIFKRAIDSWVDWRTATATDLPSRYGFTPANGRLCPKKQISIQLSSTYSALALPNEEVVPRDGTSLATSQPLITGQ
jgi:hypothetical protein